jgi:hypothetical protein
MIEDACDTHGEAIHWRLGEVHFFRRDGDAPGPALHTREPCRIGEMQKWLTSELGQGPWRDREF